MEGKKKDCIIAILKKHEQRLSDGFGYYAPSWLAEYGDIEGVDGFIEIVATEILAALEEI